MKKAFLLGLFLSALTMTAQEKKQYKSAETGQYVSKSSADKSPSTTYSTPRKSSGTSSSSTTTSAPKVTPAKTTTTTRSSSSRKSKF